jgi:acetate---CoA ligase (ADP-forming)
MIGMEKIFNPGSIVVIGLSGKPNNIPKMILDNLLRWAFRGRIFGVSATAENDNVRGIKIYKSVEDLPEVPDMALCVVPARFVPGYVESCGRFGIKHMAIPSGGFAEYSEDGRRLSEDLLSMARKYDIRFVGPNGLTVADTASGLCLSFIPCYPPPKGGMSIITQSGLVGQTLFWLLQEERVGMAKFASIGNKLDLDEADFLEYFIQDPDTKIICMYLESIVRGDRLVELARTSPKPIVIYKSNTTNAGKKAAISHTAALSNDDETVDAAFKEAGIIRVRMFSDFLSVAKAFELPPMRGNKIMVMSPAGGFGVITADLCERAGFEFADPGKEFYQSLSRFKTTAGVINFSNPLDVGDIHNAYMNAQVRYEVLHNDKVDGLIYIGQRPPMPGGDNPLVGLMTADITKEIYGAILSSHKPMAVCIHGVSETLKEAKDAANYPIFNSPEEGVRALALQRDWYAYKAELSSNRRQFSLPEKNCLREWIAAHKGDIGEECLDFLRLAGVPVVASSLAKNEDRAVELAAKIGYPLVMKVSSPDALHKTEAGGVIIGIVDEEGVRKGFVQIRTNLETYKKGARFEGVRLGQMAADGHDMFIGGKCDASFGPVVLFGLGGIYIEVFRDVATCLCPTDKDAVMKKLKSLKSYGLLHGARGAKPADVDGYVDAIVKTSQLLVEFREIRELDINPLRLLKDGSGLYSLDARMRIET